MRDGTTIDLSGLTAREALARLVALGVTYADVRATITEIRTREQWVAAVTLDRLSTQ